MTPSIRIQEAHLSEAGRKAAESLAAWIGHPVRMDWSRPETVAAEDAGDLFGPQDAEVAACVMEVHGVAHGRFVLVIDAAGIARFVNAMMGLGTEVTADQRRTIAEKPGEFWDELARSAALETSNIVACAFLNVLAKAMEGKAGTSGPVDLLPTPPTFKLDFAGSLSQMLIADVADDCDGVLLTRSRIHVEDAADGDWRLVWVPLGQVDRAGECPEGPEA